MAGVKKLVTLNPLLWVTLTGRRMGAGAVATPVSLPPYFCLCCLSANLLLFSFQWEGRRGQRWGLGVPGGGKRGEGQSP